MQALRASSDLVRRVIGIRASAIRIGMARETRIASASRPAHVADGGRSRVPPSL
jgi:hypothetical protein